MITSYDPRSRRGIVPALLVVLLLAATALTGEQETIAMRQPTLPGALAKATAEPQLLLVMEQPRTDEVPVPGAVPETVAVASTPASPPETPAIATTENAVAANPAVQAPKPARKNPVKTANTAKSAASQNQDPAETAPVPGAVPEKETMTAGTAAKTAESEPETLHTAINRAAKEYAQSQDVKSTRPGEDPPFTITVGGSVQVRGEYRSGGPKHGYGGLTHNGGTTEMRTRLSLLADFGQVQCAVEGDITQPGHGFYHPAGVD